jgi:hypothetical protein
VNDALNGLPALELLALSLGLDLDRLEVLARDGFGLAQPLARVIDLLDVVVQPLIALCIRSSRGEYRAG